MTPIISIVVPVYNVDKYLSYCLKSLIGQTFKHIEILLINDGSTDKSATICNEFAKLDQRIKVIHKENGGHAVARNLGIDLATGQYIMFVDSDDYVHPNYCEIMYNEISNNPTCWVFCDMQRVDINNAFVPSFREVITNCHIINNPTYFEAFKFSLSGSVSNKIYSVDAIRNNHITFDKRYKLGEDVQFDISYYNNCAGIQFVPKALYFYRVVSDSLTHSYHSDHLEIYINLFSKRLPLIHNNELTEFCDIYFNYLVNLLDNTLDKRNTMSFIQKMRYNNKMMNTKEFKYCVANASGKNDSKLFMFIVRMHNYYIYWLFQKACKIKDYFRKNKHEVPHENCSDNADKT